MHTYPMNQAALLDGRLDVRVEVSGYRAIARLVASGAGIGIVPRSALGPSDREQIAVIGLAERWAARHHRVCVRLQTLKSNHYLRELVKVLCPKEGAGPLGF